MGLRVNKMKNTKKKYKLSKADKEGLVISGEEIDEDERKRALFKIWQNR